MTELREKIARKLWQRRMLSFSPSWEALEDDAREPYLVDADAILNILKEHGEEAVEGVARKLAARKMGLVKHPNGDRLPEDLWRQCEPEARAAISAFLSEGRG